jgi:hypothetical protein
MAVSAIEPLGVEVNKSIPPYAALFPAKELIVGGLCNGTAVFWS